MADTISFDITTGCDMQEVDNAINQAHKELTQRYDFRGVTFTLELQRADNKLLLAAPDDFKVQAIWDVVQQKLIKRGVPIQNIKAGEPQAATGGSIRLEYTLAQGIDADVAKKIVKFIKEQKLKKVQASIQKEQVRVAGQSRDELQQAIALLKAEDFGIALSFGNYR